jgi:Fe-Mn family superoxide dismutase
MDLTRRTWIRSTSVAAAGVAAGISPARSLSGAEPAEGEPFSLPPLPYPANALEPAIDARTMEIHHGAHHAGYVKKLNAAVARAPSLAGKSVESILKDLDAVPEAVRAEVRNNGGGHANHSFFWKIMGPGKGGVPTGHLAEAIRSAFGDFPAFREAFSKAAIGLFGSGWAWLVADGEKLSIVTAPNQDSPISRGLAPVLGLDVWEHAYYLKYQNRRADYVAAFFGVIDWEAAARHFDSRQR